MTTPRGATEKACRRCQRMLHIADYYVHKAMADGHLNICKDCVKERVNRRYVRLMANDPSFVAAERARNLARALTPDGYALHRRMKEVHPEKFKARDALARAVKSGRINKPVTCSRCGDSGGRIEGHHHDYSKPLDVMWLCTRCHGLEHRVVLAKLQAP